eukprot:CAMPEP_0118652576 /NCGR_PEP_ID=MMETSP0785-20121206/11389_1 /TAXON_ID=91992 /ORGANISM="Bolidomonas pacifica, Strain CCMP 1866" /LENGTH=190 /DNA_ID=CAMNT_0006545097 /DNA_START=60 /DNA_END=629 /DNA_ORIENTATION=+
MDVSRQGPSIKLALTSPPIYAAASPHGLPPSPSLLSSFYSSTVKFPHAPAVSTRIPDGPYIAMTYVKLMEQVLKLYLSLTTSFLSPPGLPSSSSFSSSSSSPMNVCVLLPNSPTFTVISLATSSLHSALVPLYTTSTQEHREYIVQQTLPVLMYVDYRLLHLLPKKPCEETTLVVTGGPIPASFSQSNFQ